MDVIADPAGIRERTDAVRAAGSTVGLVPTMGALHRGHASVFDRVREDEDHVVVSIFVNPLQFEDPDDLAGYATDPDADLALCEAHGVDTVWMPSVAQVYPPGTRLPDPDPGPVGGTFEGASRPGHFAGMLKVVHRIFDVIGPCTAAFGQKDAQQVFLVRRMVAGEALPVRILECPTVREPDGVALSSRNARLSPDEREQAACLFLGLSDAAAAARAGERDAAVLVAAIAREVGAAPLARLDHAAVVDDATFTPVRVLEPGIRARALVAARFPNARLIDNLTLPIPEVGS